jgi:hypothetical protein
VNMVRNVRPARRQPGPLRSDAFVPSSSPGRESRTGVVCSGEPQSPLHRAQGNPVRSSFAPKGPPNSPADHTLSANFPGAHAAPFETHGLPGPRIPLSAACKLPGEVPHSLRSRTTLTDVLRGAGLGRMGKRAVAACCWHWDAGCRPRAETGSEGQNPSSISKLVNRRGGAFLNVRWRHL